MVSTENTPTTQRKFMNAAVAPNSQIKRNNHHRGKLHETILFVPYSRLSLSTLLTIGCGLSGAKLASQSQGDRPSEESSDEDVVQADAFANMTDLTAAEKNQFARLVNNLIKTATNLTFDLNEIASRCVKLNNDLDAAKAQLSPLIAEQVALEGKVTGLNRQTDALEGAIKRSRDPISAARGEVRSLTKAISVATKDSRKQLNEYREGISKKIDEQQSQLIKARQDLASASDLDSPTELINQVIAQGTKIAAILETIEDLQEERVRITQYAKDDLASKVADLNRQLDVKKKELEAVEKQNQPVISELRKALHTANVDLSKSRVELRKFKAKNPVKMPSAPTLCSKLVP